MHSCIFSCLITHVEAEQSIFSEKSSLSRRSTAHLHSTALMPENLRVSLFFIEAAPLGFHFQPSFIPHCCCMRAREHCSIQPQPGACRGEPALGSESTTDSQDGLLSCSGHPTPMESPGTLAPLQQSKLGPDLLHVPLRSLPTINCHQLLTNTQYAGHCNGSKQVLEPATD